MYMSGATKKCKLVSEVKSKNVATLQSRTSLENRKKQNRQNLVTYIVLVNILQL